MDIHRAGLAVKVEAPGFLQDLLTAENQSAVFSQGKEQVKFLGTQIEGPGRDTDFPSRLINSQIAKLDGRSAVCFHGAFAAS